MWSNIRRFKFTSDNGYERGITHLITKHLKDMVTEPIHCSGDNSHLQFYMKDENKWEEIRNIKN